MESRFGYDFGSVRLHSDAKAAESARAINASAYTIGRNVAFGTGQLRPSNIAGRRLLAHELVHTVHQSGIQDFVKTSNCVVQRKTTRNRGGTYRGKVISIRDVKPEDRPTIDRTKQKEAKVCKDIRSGTSFNAANCPIKLDPGDEITILGQSESPYFLAVDTENLLGEDRKKLYGSPRAYILKGFVTREDTSREQQRPAADLSESATAEADKSPSGLRSPKKRSGASGVSRQVTETERSERTFDEYSGVIKGEGDIPKQLQFLGEKWELRFIQKGKCEGTYIFRLKVTENAKRKIGKHMTFEGKLRWDMIRLSHNICSGEWKPQTAISWEGQLTLAEYDQLERMLEKKGIQYKAGSVEVVVKPQIGGVADIPYGRNTTLRVRFFAKLRGAVEVYVGNNTKLEFRWHPVDCDFATFEIEPGGHSIVFNINRCRDALVDSMSTSAGKPKIIIPEKPILPPDVPPKPEIPRLPFSPKRNWWEMEW